MGAAQRSSPQPGAFAAQAVRQRLQDWVHGVLDDVTVSYEAPGRIDPATRCVGLYFLELCMQLPSCKGQAPALEFGLRYLVTTWGDAEERRQDDLCELAFAALDAHEMEVDPAPPAPALWTAFGTPPRPAFSIRVPLRRGRAPAPARRVLSPLRVTAGTIDQLRGVVVATGGTPIAGARVDVPVLGRFTETDYEGRFTIAGVPAGAPLRVRIRARGLEQEFDALACAGPEGVLRLQLDLD